MQRVNIGEPVFEYDDDDPDGFRAGMFRFGKLLNARQLGTTVYELPPGQSICPYHYEYGEEEWLLVLSGRPTLRHPEGSDELETWDVVCFPSGPAGAHAIHNDTDETVRVLMYSTLDESGGDRLPGQRQDRRLARQRRRQSDRSPSQRRGLLVRRSGQISAQARPRHSTGCRCTGWQLRRRFRLTIGKERFSVAAHDSTAHGGVLR